MRKIILLSLLLVMVFFNQTQAQTGYPKKFDRFDSTSTLFGIKGLQEDANHYILYNDYHVLKVDQLNGSTDTFYVSTELIQDAFIDSMGNFGLLLSNKLLIEQAGNWQAIIIPTGANALKAMVDSSGAIFVVSTADSIFKYQYGNWVNSKLYFPSTYEHFKCFVAANNHHCLIAATPHITSKIFEFDGNDLILKYSLPCNCNTNLEMDPNGNMWYLSNGSLKKMSVNGFENSVYIPNPGIIASFKLAGSNGEFWYSKSSDSLYYFDGTNKSFVFTEEDNLNLFKVQNNKLLVLNKTKQNLYENQNVMSFIAGIQGNQLINRFNFRKPVISQNVNAILVCDVYSTHFQNEFLIATNEGLYLRRNQFNSRITYKKWDTLNSALPTNSIYDMASYDDLNLINQDTVYLATDKGIIKVGIEQDSLIVYQIINHQNSDLPSDTVTALCFKDKINNSELWAGTFSKGVAKLYSNGIIQVVDSTNSLLPSNEIKHISIKENIVCITTKHGFLVLTDTIQRPYSTFNSGLLTDDLNSVNIYTKYNLAGSNADKYVLIVNTNGLGFALVDTSNIWHYYNTQNQNFSIDTVVFYDFWNSFGYELFVGTSQGVKIISGNPSSINSNDWNIVNYPNNLKTVDFHLKMIDCMLFGYRGGVLCKNGIIAFQECVDGVIDRGKNLPTFETYFNGNHLMIKQNFTGVFLLDVYDITGKRIHTVKEIATESSEISMPSLNEGIYLVKLYNESQTYTKKVLYTK